jgi:ubiquinone/menaquinone biosynthesis C-methylase UbiE
MIHKFENPKRLSELAVTDTLGKLGLDGDSVFCDVGAGTGIFTFAAARITCGTVYSVEISHEMLEVLGSRLGTSDVANVKILDRIEDVPSGLCDLILLCAVLHEVEDVSLLLRELDRILKADGTLTIIEFHKRQTSMGPPVEERLSENEVTELLDRYSFSLKDKTALGDNFYCLHFGKSSTT